MPNYTEYSYAKVLSNYMEKHSLYEALYVRERLCAEQAKCQHQYISRVSPMIDKCVYCGKEWNV